MWISAVGGSYLTSTEAAAYFKAVGADVPESRGVSIQNNGSFQVYAGSGVNEIAFALYDADLALEGMAMYSFVASGDTYYSYLGRNKFTGYIYIFEYSKTADGASTNGASNELLIRQQ